MQLSHDEFIRRFLLHILPSGFHRIRHYGLVANAGRKRNLKQASLLLHAPQPKPSEKTEGGADYADTFICPKCHAPMVIIELLIGINYPRAPPERIINPVEKMAL